MQIYMITNLKTGKSYIGKDQRDNPYYMGSGLLIWNSYRKEFNNPDLSSSKRSSHKWVYDENEKLHYYLKTVLDECDDPKQLCELEKYYINKYNTIRPNGYNIANGGNGGVLILGYTDEEKEQWKRKISEKTKIAMQREDIRANLLEQVQNKSDSWRKHISESLTGRKGQPMTEEMKRKLSERNKGNKYALGNHNTLGTHLSEEHKMKISESGKKVIHTEEWNKKVSESLKGRPKSESHKAALRKPKPKYKWMLPDGSFRIMDSSNGGRHEGWVKLERIS